MVSPKHVLWRLAHALLILLSISFLTFLLSELAPGDYLSELELAPQVSARTLEEVRLQLGLDQPLLTRWWHWLQSVGRGELGFSIAHQQPVRNLLQPRLVRTLLLLMTGYAASWLVALAIGIWSAEFPGGSIDRFGNTVCAVLQALPEILIVMFCLLLAVRWGLVPAGGMTSLDFASLSLGGRFIDLARHLILPTTALTLLMAPTLYRHVRAAMVDALHAQHITFARSLGIPLSRTTWRHGVLAASNPLVSLFGVSVASLLSNAFLVEVIMGWPGLGPLLVEATLARDLHVVVAVTLASASLLLAGNFVSDLLLPWVDPRARTFARAPAEIDR